MEATKYKCTSSSRTPQACGCGSHENEAKRTNKYHSSYFTSFRLFVINLFAVVLLLLFVEHVKSRTCMCAGLILCCMYSTLYVQLKGIWNSSNQTYISHGSDCLCTNLHGHNVFQRNAQTPNKVVGTLVTALFDLILVWRCTKSLLFAVIQFICASIT